METTFMGYRRPDGTVGVRNYLAVIPSVFCANTTAEKIAARIPGAVFCPTLPDVTETLRKIAQPGDLILTVGAGDIYTAGEALVKG